MSTGRPARPGRAPRAAPRAFRPVARRLTALAALAGLADPDRAVAVLDARMDQPRIAAVPGGATGERAGAHRAGGDDEDPPQTAVPQGRLGAEPPSAIETHGV